MNIKSDLKLKLFIALLLLFPILLSGCWDRDEVDELAIVVGLGVDQIPGSKPVLLTAQIANPSALGKTKDGGGTEKPFIVLTGQGKTLFDAIRDLAKSSPRKLFFAHCKLIVMGKDFAQSGITEMQDFLERDFQFRRTVFMAVAENTAKEVLEAKLDLEKLPARGIDKMMRSLLENGFIYPIDRNKFLLRMKSDAQVSFAPLIQLVDQEKETKNKLEQVTGKPVESSEKDSVKKIQTERTALFKRDRLIGVLSANESRGLLWLINKIKEDTVIFPYRADKGKGEEEVSVNIFEANTNITPRITGSNITMEIRCTGSAQLRGAGNTYFTVKNQNMLKQFEQKTEKKLKEQVEQTIASAQEKYNADFVEFSHNIHNANPSAWYRINKDWDQIFPSIKYNVIFEIDMSKIGIVNNSIEENVERE